MIQIKIFFLNIALKIFLATFCLNLKKTSKISKFFKENPFFSKKIHFFPKVNHLAHFLLINRLLDRLKKNSPARIIVVSSICHSWHEMAWDDLQAEKQYEKYLQYSQSKLANHLFTFALSRRLKETGVTCNVLEPGVTVEIQNQAH